jgi:uncharacterized protein involved in type VI secretion and phage assembly
VVDDGFFQKIIRSRRDATTNRKLYVWDESGVDFARRLAEHERLDPQNMYIKKMDEHQHKLVRYVLFIVHTENQQQMWYRVSSGEKVQAPHSISGVARITCRFNADTLESAFDYARAYATSRETDPHLMFIHQVSVTEYVLNVFHEDFFVPPF